MAGRPTCEPAAAPCDGGPSSKALARDEQELGRRWQKSQARRRGSRASSPISPSSPSPSWSLPLSHVFPSIAHSLSSQVPFRSPERTLDTTSSWSTSPSEDRVRCCSVSCQCLMTSSQTSVLNLRISWPIPPLESNSVRAEAVFSCTSQFGR